MMFAIFVLLLAAPQPQEAPREHRRLAVLELHSKLKGVHRDDVDVGYLTDVVRATALKQVPGLHVMTRENMLVLLQTVGKKPEDCEGTCEVDTGRLLGADLVISGEVLRFGSAFKLNLKLHETGDGRLLAGTQASGRTIDELDLSIQRAVSDLVQPLLAREEPKQKTSAPPDGGVPGGVQGGVVGGVVGGVLGAPPEPARAPAQPSSESKPATAESKPADTKVASKPLVTDSKAASADAKPPPAESKPLLADTRTPSSGAPSKAPSAPAAEVSASAPPAHDGIGFGLYLGGALDPIGKTMGGQAALVLGANGPWIFSAGVAISPHPGVRVALARSFVDGPSADFALEPRVSFTPFPGGSVIGGGLGARLALHAARWLDVVAGAGVEVNKGPDSTFVVPLLTLGLEPRL